MKYVESAAVDKLPTVSKCHYTFLKTVTNSASYTPCFISVSYKLNLAQYPGRVK